MQFRLQVYLLALLSLSLSPSKRLASLDMLKCPKPAWSLCIALVILSSYCKIVLCESNHNGMHSDTRHFTSISPAGDIGFFPTSRKCTPSITQQAVSSLIVSTDYNTPGPTNGVNTLPLPPSGTCDQFLVALFASQPCTTSPTGTLTLELWLVDGTGTPIPVQRSIPGLYLVTQMAQGNVMYPALQIISDDLYNGQIPLKGNATAIQDVTTLKTSSIYDSSSTLSARTSQRIVIPTGLVPNWAAEAEPQSWHISLANLNAIPSWTNISYSLRATCLSGSPPAPRAGPYLTECSGNGVGSNGQCTCNPSWGGLNCGIKVPSLSLGSQVTFKTSATSWSFFSMTLPPSASVNLLIQLTQPNGTSSNYQPVIVIRPLGLSAQIPMFDPPGLSDALLVKSQQSSTSTPSSISLPGSINFYCASGLYSSSAFGTFSYLVGNVSVTNFSGLCYDKTWYIGILNLATTEPSQSLTLSPSWSGGSGGSGGSPATLCPMDCSNQGTCSAPYLPSSFFSCSCNPDYSGPYCQGSLTALGSFTTSDLVDLSPGEWKYFTYSFPTTGVSPLLVVLQFNQMQGSPALYINQNYLPSTSSQGINFLGSPIIITSFTTTITFKLGSTWMFALFNSNASSTSNATCRFTLNFPSSTLSSSDGLNLIQVVALGGSSTLVIFMLLLLGVKFYLTRQYFMQRQDLIWVQRQIMAAEAADARREDRRGVPEEVIATFQLFSFNYDEYKKDLEERAEAKKLEDEKKKSSAVRETPSTSATALTNPIENKHKGEKDIEMGEKGQPMTDEEGELESDGEDEKEEPEPRDNVDDSDLFSCTICIADFEEGEMLRSLPCNHTFHKDCIDPWMLQHTTCPNCRRGLCPRRRRARNNGPRVTLTHLMVVAEQRRAQAGHIGRNPSSNRIRSSNDGGGNASARLSRTNQVHPARGGGWAGGGHSEAVSIRVRPAVLGVVTQEARGRQDLREVEMMHMAEVELPGTPTSRAPAGTSART